MSLVAESTVVLQCLVHHLLLVSSPRHVRAHFVTLTSVLLLLHLSVVHVLTLIFNNVKHCSFLVLLNLVIHLLFAIVVLVIVVIFIIVKLWLDSCLMVGHVLIIPG